MATILVLAEHREGRVKKGSLEAIATARRLADASGGEVVALMVGGDTAALAPECGRYGADRVLGADGPGFAAYAPEAWRDAVLAALSEVGAQVLLGSASSTGFEVLARVAARLDVGMLSEAVELSIEGERLVGRRPVYAGKARARAELRTRPALATLRANVFPLTENARPAVVQALAVSPGAVRARVLRREQAPEAVLDVAEAETVVSAGRGLKGPEHLTLVRELARTLGGAVGASRAIVDAGWIGHSHQVGQTGKTVSPKLYIALGISGAIQHLAGMSSSKVIVAVNKDADAPIFKVASYGVVSDVFDFVPAFDRALKEYRARHG